MLDALPQLVDVHFPPACQKVKGCLKCTSTVAACSRISSTSTKTNLQLPEAKNLPSELTQEHRRPLLSFNAAFVTPFSGILLQRKPEMST
jgi:hypothetical protein